MLGALTWAAPLPWDARWALSHPLAELADVLIFPADLPHTSPLTAPPALL